MQSKKLFPECRVRQIVKFAPAVTQLTSTDCDGPAAPMRFNCSSRVLPPTAIIEKLKSLKLSYPVVSEEPRQHLLEAKELLENDPS